MSEALLPPTILMSEEVAASDAVATHWPAHDVVNVYWALKSGSGCCVATLVPIFSDANVTTV